MLSAVKLFASKDKTSKKKKKDKTRKKDKKKSKEKTAYASDESDSSDENGPLHTGSNIDRHSEGKLPNMVDSSDKIAKDIHAREALAMAWMSKPMKPSVQKTEVEGNANSTEGPKNDGESTSKPSNLENQTGLGSSPGAPSTSTPATVGDGGLGWRLRALQRAKERAEREGTSVNREVEARWGSLDSVVNDLEKETSAISCSSRPRRLPRDGDSRRESGGSDFSYRRRDYKSGEKDSWKRNSSSQDEKPSGRWRKGFQEERKLQSEAKQILSDVKAFARSENQKTTDESMFLKEPDQAKSSGFADHLSDSSHSQHKPAEKRRHAEGSAVQSRLSQLTSGGSNQKFAAMLRDRLHKGSGAGAFDDVKQAAARERSAASDLHAALVDEKGVSRALQAKARSGADGSGGDSIRAMQLRERLDIDDDSKEVKEELRRQKGFFSGAEYDPELEYEDANLNEDAKRRKLSAKDIRREARHKEAERNRVVTREIRDARQLEAAKDKSWYTRYQKLLFAVSPRAYCMVPPSRECPLFFGDGHCLVVARDADPKGGTRSADEDTWEEFRNFKKCLMHYGASLSPPREFIFTEIVLREAKHRYHTFLEAIPVPREVVQSAPVWYRKALDDASDEWTDTHHSKRCIPTKGREGLLRAIPKGFAYFHVEFGMGDLGGFVHVIDDEESFHTAVGQSVAASLLGYEAGEGRMGTRERERACERMREAFKPFDWTRS